MFSFAPCDGVGDLIARRQRVIVAATVLGVNAVATNIEDQGNPMAKLDQERVQKAIDRAYDAEVGHLFRTFIENLTEAAGAGGGDFTKIEQCVGAFRRSMKRLTFAYDKAGEVAQQIVTTDAKP